VPPARPADRQKSGDVDSGAIMPSCTIAWGGVFAALSRLAKVFAAIGKLDNPKRLAHVSQLALPSRIAYRRMCDLDAELRIDRLFGSRHTLLVWPPLLSLSSNGRIGRMAGEPKIERSSQRARHDPAPRRMHASRRGRQRRADA
jgi:hypothetical protein